MRISALHLQAYGHFAGRSLTFGSQPGLHVIYGDNEAGKSTLLRAISSVLFGYPHEVVDGHKYDPKDITLGAELVARDGSILSFLRRRRGKNALARVDGTLLEDAAVARMLGGVAKDVFEKVFALDHRRLHEHARSLLAEGGSLGFTLAAAGSGIAGLKATLERSKAERAKLFLPSGSKPKLNQQITLLSDLRREARKRSVSPAEYKKRQREIDEIEALLDDARTKAREIDAELRKLERIARNLPLGAQRAAVLNKLETLASVPILGADVSQKRVKAETERSAAEADLAAANQALAALESNLSDIVLDEAVLGKCSEIEELSAQRAVVENADKSLPRRDAERAQHYGTVRDLLADAELTGSPTELAVLLPSLARRKRVSTLADKGRTFAAQEEMLKEAASAASANLQLATERLTATEAPADLTALNGALLAAETLGDIQGEIVKRTRALGTKARTKHDAIVGLGVKQGDASALRKLRVPSDETVARFRQAFATADAEQTAHRADMARLDVDLKSVETRIEKLGRGGSVVTKEELEASRAARDDAWAVVRGLYIEGNRGFEDRLLALAGDGDLADEFERRESNADRAADAIIAHTKEATELSLSAHEKIEIEHKIAVAETEGTAIQVRRQKLEIEWRGLWPLDTISVRSPVEMSEWLKQRDTLLREDIEQQGERDAISELSTKETSARDRLLSVLKGLATVDDDITFGSLRSQVRTIIDTTAVAATKHAKAVEALESARQRNSQADAARNRIAGQISEWSAAWMAALRDAGLNDALSTDAAITVLDVMTSLDALKLQIDELSHRIDTMINDKAEFQKCITALDHLVAGNAGKPATEISRQLEARLKTAKAIEARYRSLGDQHRIRSEAQHQASDRLARSRAALDALCAAAACDDTNALAEIEQKSASKQDATNERDRLEQRMLEEGAGLSLEALLSECGAVVGDTVPGKIKALTDDRGELEAEIEKLITERAGLRAAFDALFGQDQAAETLQEAANVEANIAALTKSYTDFTLQEIALRQAIDLYRDRNQGPILHRAKTLFAQLTDGAYSGLRADVDEHDDPVLIAEHATRGSLEINALSDGTIDSLYLALRLAAVQGHNATNEPLPFVADDLLLNLDNTRARSTLRTLGTLAETGQVLFFTHHAHMVELARATLPAGVLSEHHL